MISSLLGRIAASYYFMEKYEAALESNLRRLKLKEELNDKQWIAGTLDDIASIYQGMGNYPASRICEHAGLMVSFHRTLSSPTRAGKANFTKTDALGQAALKLLKNPETSHPFYWAGFVLVGDGR